MNLNRHILLSDVSAGTVRFLSGIHVTLDEGKTQSWVTVTRTGIFNDPRYGQFEITRQLLSAMVANFDKKVYGQDVFYDVAHEPAKGAAGKVLTLKVEGDRLRALVDWTPYGIDAIKNKGYAYSSIEYHEKFQDNETGTQYGPVMMGAALVVRPCIKRLDPIQLSEASGRDVPTLMHPELQSTLLQEIHVMWKELLKQLAEKLGSMKLAQSVVASLMAAAEKSLHSVTDEAAAKSLMGVFEDSGKQLAEAIGDKVVQLSIAAPEFKAGLTADDVKKLMAAEALAQATAAKSLADGKAANLKLLSDTINAAKGLDDVQKKQLADSVADLITASLTPEQVKLLADNQIAHGNALSVARQLSSIGFQRQGSVHITLDESNNIKLLQETMDRRLGILDRPDAERFSNTGGKLQEKNKKIVEKILSQFDAERGAQLHREHKMLAGGDGSVSDVAVPGIFERTVIREALYNMIGLQFVDVGTAEFAQTVEIPYSYRDTSAAGRNNVRVYEGGSIPRAGVIQTSDLVYPIPQKLAFEVSDELRYLTGNGQLNWDALSENARNASRIIGEDGEQLIFNEILNASDEYAAVQVANETVGVANGTKTIFPLGQFPVVHPRTIYTLKGVKVGNTLNPIVVRDVAVVIAEYNGTNTQAAGLYYTMDFNLGEIHFVNQLGAPTAPANTHTITADYSVSSNTFKFDMDMGSVAAEVFWDGFMYRYGLRKAVIESDRYHMANFGLMSSTVKTTVEQARSFVESFARNGTSLDTDGNLGMVKSVPNFRTTAPGLYMGDQRVVIGERGVTRYRMLKAWTMGQLQDQRDTNGRFTGKKEAYGDQFIALYTPPALKSAYTTLSLYSSSARVSR